MKKEKAKKLFEDFDKEMSKDEALFAVFNKDNEKESDTLIVVPNTTKREAQVASILAKHILRGLNGKETDRVLADIMVFAVKKAFEWQEEGYEEVYDDDEDYKEEECADCKYMRTCNEENAIKYRKMHNIPKPKKKSNKK